MDANGKPRMSRQLLQRLMDCGQPPAVKATQVSATPQAFQQRRWQEANGNRQHVGNYRRSSLANQSYIRRPGGEISADRRSDTAGGQQGVLRERINSGVNRPSAGFQEPPSRGCNPFA
ncbi:MAG: hypothetical protein Q4B05_00535 [Candidatus Saccharibacteria bacterium]|nr:hypothetical protein [Candidatus Saccharibacteria bacterium]